MITKKLKILLRLELKRILKNGRSSTKRISSMVMMVLVGLAMVFYSALFTMILVTSNHSKELALTFGLVLSLLTFFTGISNGNKNLFSRDEFEILYPMPLGEGDILMAKFIGIYLDSLFYAFAIFLIPIVWFGIIHGPLAFILNLLSVLVLPILPTFLGVLLATQISKTFRFHNTKTVLQVLGTVLFFGTYIFIMTQADKYGDQVLALWSRLSWGLRTYYLPLRFFDQAFSNQSFLGFLALFVLTALLLLLLGYFIIRNYIHNFYKEAGAGPRERKKSVTFSTRSKLQSLYKKEVKHYFWRTNYVSNTILSPILILGLGVAAFFIKPDQVFGQISGSLPGLDLAGIASYILAFVSVNAQTTYCSLSLEGENFEILEAMPLTFKDLVLPRVLLGMTLALGPILFTSLAFVYVGQVGIINGIFMVLAGILANLFGNLVGIYFDLMTLDLDWKNDLEVIKQRFSGILMSLAMVLPMFISWILTTLLNIKFVIPTSLIMCLSFMASIAIVYLMLEGAKDRVKLS